MEHLLLTAEIPVNIHLIDFDSITISAGKDITWQALVLEYNAQVELLPDAVNQACRVIFQRMIFFATQIMHQHSYISNIPLYRHV